MPRAKKVKLPKRPGRPPKRLTVWTPPKLSTKLPYDADDMAEKVLAFCELHADKTLYPYQRPLAKAIIWSLVTGSGHDITALMARQIGKSETLAVTISGILVILPTLAQYFPDSPLGMFKEGVWVGIFAPQAEQAYTLWSRVHTRIKNKQADLIRSDPEIGVSVETNKANPLVLSNGSVCRYQSADPRSKIESKSYHLIVIDEAQDVDETVAKKSIRPMGAAYNATIVQIGTPTTKKSLFYEMIRLNKQNNPHLHFEADWQVAAKYNPWYAKFIEKEIVSLGEDSDEFRMSYALQWIFERGMFMTAADFDEYPDGILDPSLAHKEKDTEGYCVAGIDIGKNEDSTVITVGRVNLDKIDEWGNPEVIVLNWLELLGDDHEEQWYQMVDFLNRYNVKVIYIDSTGKGEPIANRMYYEYEGRALVVPYVFSRPTISAMFRNMQNYIRARSVRVPAHPSTRKLRVWQRWKQQMEDLEKEYQGQHLIVRHPKRKGYHDDYAYSFGLMLLAAKEDALPEVEVLDNPFFGHRR